MDIAGTLRSWWSDRQAEGEFHAMSGTDRAAIARDLGLPDGRLEQIVEHGGPPPVELPRMLEALHLDPAQVARKHGGVMRDLEATCAGCDERAQCHRDLDRGIAAGGYKAYCPNAVTLDALLREQNAA